MPEVLALGVGVFPSAGAVSDPDGVIVGMSDRNAGLGVPRESGVCVGFKPFGVLVGGGAVNTGSTVDVVLLSVSMAAATVPDWTVEVGV